MAIRQPLSTGTSESSIIFYNGGHNHDGISSARIDTAKYSLYDFTTDFMGTDLRQSVQAENFRKFTNVVSDIVKTNVLGPSGITLGPRQVRAENIDAGAVTATSLAANIVLVNNVIRSNNFDGTVLANGAITTAGTVGWAVSGGGTAVFDSSYIRGTLTAGALYINAYNQWYANGSIYVGNPQFDEPGFSYSVALGMSVRGSITATSGKIGDFDISDGTLITGGFIGWIALGPTPSAAYGGVEAGEIAVATRDPADNHDVRATMRGEYFQVQDADEPARISYMDKDGFGTNGIVACDSVQTSGIVYQWGVQQITFKWDGSTFYAVIDGNEYALAASGGAPATTSPATAPATTTSPATTTTTSPATTTTTSPGGGCIVCSTPGVADCCPPSTCGSFKDGFICLDLSGM